jgi:hypothetical protein
MAGCSRGLYLYCGRWHCHFYVRYPGPFDYTIHAMPAREK